MYYLEHHITDHCNLNCNGCSHFSPLATPWYEDFEQFNKDFSCLAEKSNHYVNIIRIMGGEPLLHPQWAMFLKRTRELFPKSEIHLVTNGILIKKYLTELLEICNSYSIVICVSNYHIIDLHSLLKDFKYRRIDEKGQLYHIGLCINNQNNLNAFLSCDLHTNYWYYFQSGKFFPCCIGANIHYLNTTFNTDFPLGEGISIYNHTLSEIEHFLNQPQELCKYCNIPYRFSHLHTFSPSAKEKKEWIYQ